MRTIKILTLVSLLISQVIFAQPIKPLCELLEESYVVQFQQAKTNKEKEKITKEYIKRAKKRNCLLLE